jgi:leucyl aminopeptidase
MKITLKPTDPAKIEADVLIVFSWEEKTSDLPAFNTVLRQTLKEAIIRETYEGKEEDSLMITAGGQIASYKLLLHGLGKKEDYSIYRLFKSIALAVKKAQSIKPARVAITVPAFWMEKFGTKIAVESLVEACSQSLYKFMKYKSEEEKNKFRNIEEVIILIPAGKISAASEGIKTGTIFSEAILFARDLVNEPSAITTPSFLAQTAVDISKSSEGRIKVKILDKEDISKLGMNAFLGVAKGSDDLPKFINLSYKPRPTGKKIVIIGKGITFDTGGLSLKSSEHMETMKLDMSGAAAVLAVFKALAVLKPSVEVVGLIAACENMPSGHALKPGDILRAMNGKTIEVLNTDAEGRLTLADTLSYAIIKEKPDEIIDLATLTGACMVALGEEIAGLWGNNEKLLAGIEKSAAIAGEKIWKMPFEKGYKTLIKSHIADIKNTQDGRYGGAITAALFLAEFIDNTPWVHLDIAGPAFAEKDTPLVPHGGSGFGVRLLLHYLTSD